MAANVAVAQDPAGNLKPAKDKSTERIDGIVDTIMAIGRAMVAQEEPQPEYSIVLSMSRCLAARRSFASRNPLIADRSAGSSRPDTPPPAAGSAAGPRRLLAGALLIGPRQVVDVISAWAGRGDANRRRAQELSNRPGPFCVLGA